MNNLDRPDLVNPATIIQASAAIAKLQNLLGYDLIASTATYDPSVTISIHTGKAQPYNLYIPASDLEPRIAELIHKQLELVTALGVNTAPLLAQYKSTGEKLLGAQQNKNPIDTPTEP